MFSNIVEVTRPTSLTIFFKASLNFAPPYNRVDWFNFSLTRDERGANPVIKNFYPG
jgi:hypothetical protein